MQKQMTINEVESHLWESANILRGRMDASDFKSFIFPLLFFKRISDVYDEEYQDALSESGGDLSFAEFSENHRFQIPKGSHWTEIRKLSTDIGLGLQKAMRKIELANADNLLGIFGDAQWTNKDRLPDSLLRDLIDHYSGVNLGLYAIPQDEFGTAYEYLIRKFADDSGHTAAEFYTNRTVVTLMTRIMKPKERESIYDPTCGSGGLLLNAALAVKEGGQEHRTLRLFGQELNLLTSAIARMNLFLHGIEDFQIERDDTLAKPRFLENDHLAQFDVVLANPPYSVKRWSQSSWKSDLYGRNFLGIPPQGCADYAFLQHIIKSLKAKTGRAAVLLPHGVLFRQAEIGLRRKMIEMDLVDTVIGLGANLFYNSPMESCIVVFKPKRSAGRQGKVLFINAVEQIRHERGSSFLLPEHIDKIVNSYFSDEDDSYFSRLVSNEEILANESNLSINLYVQAVSQRIYDEKNQGFGTSLDAWHAEAQEIEKLRLGLESSLKSWRRKYKDVN